MKFNNIKRAKSLSRNMSIKYLFHLRMNYIGKSSNSYIEYYYHQFKAI